MVPPLPDSTPPPLLPPSKRALEARVETLSLALARLEARVQRLEGYGGAPRAADLAPPEAAPVADPEKDGQGSLVPILGMVGQVCLILGGAFLLRTLTDGGTLPRLGGTALGLAYAVVWAVVAWRAAPPLQKLARHIQVGRIAG